MSKASYRKEKVYREREKSQESRCHFYKIRPLIPQSDVKSRPASSFSEPVHPFTFSSRSFYTERFFRRTSSSGISSCALILGKDFIIVRLNMYIMLFIIRSIKFWPVISAKGFYSKLDIIQISLFGHMARAKWRN